MKHLALTLLLLAPCTMLQAAQPNIILILADDMGSGDLNCYGADPSLLKTPHCDRLAREGIRFTDASAPASICTPTRYAILTGQYPWRTARKAGTAGDTAPLMIHPKRLTLPSMLKSAGYRTACFGKWHLGLGQPPRSDFTGELKPGPRDIGFDHYYGLAAGHDDASGVFVENEHVVGLRSETLKPFKRAFYPGDYLGLDAPQRINVEVEPHIADKTLEWMRQQKAETPFFLYYASVVPHVPYTPTAKNSGKSGCGPYGDWIQDLDDIVGRILGELDRLKLAENTLILFTSDNGSVIAPESMRGAKPDVKQAFDAGLRSNGTLRGRKHTIFEGGFRVPLLARWPARIKPGSVNDEMVNLTDLLATIAAITGQTLPPATRAAEDSFDISPALFSQPHDKPIRPHMIEQNADGVLAIRSGPWKWIEGKAAIPNPNQGYADNLIPQLYHLKDDPCEKRNLIEKHPEEAQRLQAKLNELREQGQSR